MVDRVIPDNGQLVGIPGQYTETWPDNSNALLTGHEPAVLTTDELLPASINWPALSPVTRNATTGVLSLAVAGTPATGITIVPLVTGAGVTDQKGPVYRAGCFNPDRIVWPASYDTVAKKQNAFEGAPTPTNIVIRPVQGFTETRPYAL